MQTTPSYLECPYSSPPKRQLQIVIPYLLYRWHTFTLLISPGVDLIVSFD